MKMTWDDFFKHQAKLPYFKDLMSKIDKEYEEYTIYPPKDKLFNAFKLTPFEDVKVIIIGQDPYHNPNQAMGLAFSVPKGIKIPPSLKNIYKEIENEYKVTINQNGDLTYLAKQGVLLLNAYLTVRENQPMSHHNYGYEELLRNIIELLDKDELPKVFILWGNPAKKISEYIKNKNHLILSSAHPSPLSAHNGFFNNNHFLKANEFLLLNKREPINWYVSEHITLF